MLKENKPETVVTTKPAALGRQEAAAYLSLSTTMVEELTAAGAGFPQPVQLSKRRVAWLTAELDAWLASRPRSNCLPPEGSGYGRAGKGVAA